MFTTAEIGIGALFKWLWVVILAPMGIWFYKKLDNTYNKDETKEQINMSLAPILTELQYNREARKENTAAVAKLNGTISQLLLMLAERK